MYFTSNSGPAGPSTNSNLWAPGPITNQYYWARRANNTVKLYRGLAKLSQELLKLLLKVLINFVKALTKYS